MVFVETSLFSKLLSGHLNDEEYRLLQKHLVEQPGAGDIIRGSGGVRKVRWGAGPMPKGEKETLSSGDLKKVVKLLEELSNG